MISNYKTATIKAGESLSSIVDLEQDQLIGIILPSQWTPAVVSFQGSPDGVNFYNMTYEGVEGTNTAGAEQMLMFNPYRFVGIRFIKVRSGSSTLPVAQTLDRIITIIKNQDCC